MKPSAMYVLCVATLVLVLFAAPGRARGQAMSDHAVVLQRAATLVQAREFVEASGLLRGLLAVDPANRAAKEMLAFALESMGDLAGERRVRAALAAEFPDDPRVHADYGRVLERQGEHGGALGAYRRARDLSAGAPAPELDASIERMRGRSALEVAAPLTRMSDPDATASVVQAGAAIPLGSGHHLAFLASRYSADGRTNRDAMTSVAVALTVVGRHGARAAWSAGPILHGVARRAGAPRDPALGGVVAGRARLGRWLEAEGRAEGEVPWEEAAVAVLHGGRTTAVEGRVYSRGLSRHLLLQAGARERRLSLLPSDPGTARRPTASQSLWVAGADVVLWGPGAAVRGEMLDDALIAPVTLASAMTLAYRHYDVTTRTAPEFGALIGLAPRGAVDEASASTTFASPGGRVGLELRGGLAHDAARRVRAWRAGGTLLVVPIPAVRFALGYEEATEYATGLSGRRRTGRLSFHADL